MFMSGPDNINKLPVDPLMATGAGAVKKVLRDGVSAAAGVNPKVSEGATVTGAGRDGNTAGQALLKMMQGNNILPTKGFFKGKIEEKPSDELNVIEHPINAQMKALLPEDSNPNITAAFTDLEARAKGSPTLASPQEISLGKEAIIPNTGIIIDSKSLIAALKSDARAQGMPVDINTPEATQAFVNLFHGSTRD